MPLDHRVRLAAMLSELDQVQSGVDSILRDPLYADVTDLAEDLSDLVATLKALLEVKLEQTS